MTSDRHSGTTYMYTYNIYSIGHIQFVVDASVFTGLNT